MASAAERPLAMAWAMPSPCNGFTRPAASPTSRTLPRGGCGADHAHLEPSAEAARRRSWPAARIQQSRAVHMVPRNSGKGPLRSRTRLAVRQCAQADADVDSPRRRRGRPTRSRERRAAASAPRTRWREDPRLWQVGADGEAPQHPLGVHQAGRRGHRLVAPSAPITKSARNSAARTQPVSVRPIRRARQRLVGTRLDGVAPASTAASCSRCSKTVLGSPRCRGPGRSGPRRRASVTRRPVGPTTRMSPTSRPRG